MKVFGKEDYRPTRVALVIFLGLIVFCAAQIAWWIIFQVENNQKQHQFYLNEMQVQAKAAAGLVNYDWTYLLILAKDFLDADGNNTAKLKADFESLMTDSAIVGYSITRPQGKTAIWGGYVDSAFFAAFAPEAVIYFNSSYPTRIAAKLSSNLTFELPGHHIEATSEWITPAMFSPSPKLLEQLDNEKRRIVAMYLSEGGFFFLVMLLGAYLIYRTLCHAEELKAQQQNFIHSITHELKAPVASIRLYLQTAVAGKVDTDKTREFFPKMIEDCDRLEGLIDNVLEAGHFGKTGYKLKLSPTNLSEDLNEYLDDLETMVSRHAGKIERKIKDGVMVKSDYQALHRVVSALVHNAVKYSPSDKKNIEVALGSEARQAIIEVRDEGYGIEPLEQKRIFDRFYRGSGEQTRIVKGTGLGLFLVREIVGAHGGKIKVKSGGAGQGATFIVKLPLVRS